MGEAASCREKGRAFGHRVYLWGIPWSMRKKLLIRSVFALLILLFLLYAGPRVGAGTGESFYVKNRQLPEPEYVGTITLYHIVTAKTYQGSVTAFLEERAEAFNARHFGVRITVEGMGEADFQERLSYGRRADMYSFFSGALYEEQLQELDYAPEAELREGLAVMPYAAPWCFSGYVRTDAGETSPIAALANGAEGPVMDLRAWGDIQRNGEMGLDAAPAGSFTDQVCYLGVARDTDPEKARWCCLFYEYLVSEPTQKMLSALGAFSVRTDVPCPYGNSLLLEMDRAYKKVIAPDPFLYHAHREKLREEAAAALAGDETAKNSFFQRLAIVIGS